MNRRNALLASIGGTLLTLGLAAPAMAVSWGTIIVYENGVEQGRAYGTFYNKNTQWAAMTPRWKDSRPGGNGVFVDIDYMFWTQECNECSPGYHWKGTDQTGRTTSGDWAGPTTEQHDLYPSSNSARGAIQVCEDQAWSTDPCSEPDALPTFSY